MKKLVALLGCLGAAYLSFTVSHSILWSLLHFFCGWLYVIYYFFVYFLPSGGALPLI